MAIIGLGTDIVEIQRIEKSMVRFGDKFAKRILTNEEFSIYQSHKDKVRYLAKRFAMKEAASKALGYGFREGLAFNQFGSTKNKLGKPELILLGRALEIANALNITSSHLSITDEIHYAVAVVIFEN